jgi:hypothetical protein
MGKRIYFDDFLRGAKYYPSIDSGKSAYFRIRLSVGDMRVKVYEAPTIVELIQEVKADGHVIWGKAIEDYNHSPENAYEYWLLTAYLKSIGKTDGEILEFIK